MSLDRVALDARADVDFPDQNVEFITPEKVREYVKEQNASMANQNDELPLLDGGVMKNYDPTRAYLLGDCVMITGSVFEANQDILVPEPLDLLKWTQRTGLVTSSAYDFIPWDSITPYVIDDRVSDDTKLYRSIQAGTNKKPALNPTFWEEVSANDGNFGNLWVTPGFYLENQVVNYLPEKALYWLNVDTSVNPFFSANFVTERDAGQWKSFDEVSKFNHQLVRAKNDFPAPIAGVITLGDNIAYEINGLIDIGTDRLVAGIGNKIFGENLSNDIISYTGVGSLITVTDKDLDIDNVILTAPSGTIITGSNVGLDKTLLIRNCEIAICDTVATIIGFINVRITDSFIRLADHGIDVSDTFRLMCSNLFIHQFNNIPGSNFIEVSGGTSSVVHISNCILFPETDETAIDIDLGATVVNLIVSGNTFLGTLGTYLSPDIDTEVAGYDIVGNSNVPDATDFVSTGSMFMENNATATVITVTNQWEKVLGTTVAGSNLHRFSMTGNNELTGDVGADVNKVIHVTGNAFTEGGTDDCEFTIFQNGSKVANVTSLIELQVDPEQFAFNASVVVSPGDTFEVRTRNTNDTSNITIPNMQIQIK